MQKWGVILFVMAAIGLSGSLYSKDRRKSAFDSSYTVIVLLKSKPGKEEELKQALMHIAKKSRAEKSCLEYHLYQDVAEPIKFGLYEKWKSRELHQKQFTKPYIVEFGEKAEPLLDGPYHALNGMEIQN